MNITLHTQSQDTSMFNSWLGKGKEEQKSSECKSALHSADCWGIDQGKKLDYIYKKQQWMDEVEMKSSHRFQI